MNTKHTPGPWHVEKWKIGNKKDDPTTVVVSVTDAVAFVQPLWVRDDRAEEHEANARLIAAAPEMYELLQWVAGMSATDPIAAERIEALIAKVGGR